MNGDPRRAVDGLTDAELHTLGHPLWVDGFATLPPGGLRKLAMAVADVNVLPVVIEVVPATGASAEGVRPERGAFGARVEKAAAGAVADTLAMIDTRRQ